MNATGLTAWAAMLIALAAGFPTELKSEDARLATMRPQRASLAQRCRTCADAAKRAELRSDLAALEVRIRCLRTAAVSRGAFRQQDKRYRP